MGVYEDMANDAGYNFGTNENRQMAQTLEYQQMEMEAEKDFCEEQEYYKAMQIEEYQEILFRKFITMPKSDAVD